MMKKIVAALILGVMIMGSTVLASANDDHSDPGTIICGAEWPVRD